MLPAVASMMRPPGLRVPSRSAVSTMRIAMRSLIEFPGFIDSVFTKAGTARVHPLELEHRVFPTI